MTPRLKRAFARDKAEAAQAESERQARLNRIGRFTLKPVGMVILLVDQLELLPTKEFHDVREAVRVCGLFQDRHSLGLFPEPDNYKYV